MSIKSNIQYDDTCPFCDSWDVRVGDILSQASSEGVMFKVHCNECCAEWNDIDFSQ
jgi:formate dehydrogenase maturation protein FdhE